MSPEHVLSSKDVQSLKAAQWAGFEKMAARLPNYHVLAVELVRTFDNETAAAFTVVQNRQPVRMVVFADARGRVQQPHECGHKYEALMARAVDGGDQSPDFALGPPPVHQTPTPGITALAASMLATAFDVGEHVDGKR